MNNSEVMSGDEAALGGSGFRGFSALRHALAAVLAMGGVMRDIVFVTIDALRGRYDH